MLKAEPCPFLKKLLQIKNSFYSWPCRCCSWVSARLKGGKCLRNSLLFLQQRWKVAFRSAGKTPPIRLEKRLLTFQQSTSGCLPAIWISSHCRKLLRILPRGSAWKGTDLLRKKSCLMKAKLLGAHKKALLNSNRDFSRLSHLSFCPHTLFLGCWFLRLGFLGHWGFLWSSPDFLQELLYWFKLFGFGFFFNLKLSSTLIYLSASKNVNWLQNWNDEASAMVFQNLS